MKRFDLCAKTHLDAVRYIKNRALQIAHTGAVLKNIFEIPQGVWADFEYEENNYHALYVLEQFRGQGLYYKLWKAKCDELGSEIKILTTTGCSLAQYLRQKQIPHMLVNGLTNTVEYNLIENIYGNECAKRSNVYYMNHIDEGLYILHKIGASLNAKLGYILHPIFQSDAELRNIYNHTTLNEIAPQSIINAVEYRSIANEYLSFRSVKNIDEIRLSPLKDVNDMLRADKIQNRKDFDLYHFGKHARSKELNKYFINWMERLNISSEMYETTKEELIALNSEIRVEI